MLRDYELMYILRPELDDDGVRAATEGVQALVENSGGEVTKTTPWGKRRLAYEVQHLRDGHYILLQLRLDAARVTDLERALRISDTVFRHLLVVDESPPSEEDAVAPAAAGGEADAASGSTASEGDDSPQSGSPDPATSAASAPGAAAPESSGAEPVSSTSALVAANTDEEV